MKYISLSALLILLSLLLVRCDSFNQNDRLDYLNNCMHYSDTIHYLIELSESSNRSNQTINLQLQFVEWQLKNSFGFLNNYPESNTIYNKLVSYISRYNTPDSDTYTHERALLYNNFCYRNLVNLIKSEQDKLPSD